MPFSQKVFNMGPWNLVYRHIVGTFMCVWQMAPVCQIFGPLLASTCTFRGVENMDLKVPNFWATLGPKIGQNSGLWLFSQKVSTGLHQCWFTYQFELLLEPCWILVPEAQFPGHFGPEINNNSGLQSFSQKFSTGFTSFLIYMLVGVLLGVFQWCAPMTLFLGQE